MKAERSRHTSKIEEKTASSWWVTLCTWYIQLWIQELLSNPEKIFCKWQKSCLVPATASACSVRGFPTFLNTLTLMHNKKLQFIFFGLGCSRKIPDTFPLVPRPTAPLLCNFMLTMLMYVLKFHFVNGSCFKCFCLGYVLFSTHFVFLIY